MSTNAGFALAQAVGPELSQGNNERQEKELAAWEFHDGDIHPTQPISKEQTAHDVEIEQSHPLDAEDPSNQKSTFVEANQSLSLDVNFQPSSTTQPSNQILAPSTVAQWLPSSQQENDRSEVPLTEPENPPHHPLSPQSDLASTAQTKKASSTPPRITPAFTHEKSTSLDEKSSPASSEDEKQNDLELGNRRSTSSSGTTPSTEHPAPNADTVDWEGPDDPQNPMNWSARLKWGNVAVISSITFLTPLASSMFAPGVPQVMSEFHSSNLELASFVVSIYVLGYAFGPLVIAPMSELYGRLPIYHACNILFVVFTIACAVASSLDQLIVFRFISGLFGSCPLTIGGGTIADMIPQQKRGGVMAVWALGPLMGPVIGPVAGGYLSQAKGWRWVFWVIAMAAGAITVSAIFFLRETYAPLLLERKAKKLRKETGNQNLKSKLQSPLSPSDLFKLAIVRPLRMLVLSPIVLALSTYMAVVYGYLYLLFTTITEVYESNYHFSQGSVGLTFLGIGVGSLFGVIIFGIASDRIVRAKSKQGEMKAEYRLPPMIPGAYLVPIGLFLYGWSADKHVFWIVPIIGTGIVGIGLLATFMPIQTYLVDAFTIYAASALAANTVLRSLVGALLPLAGRKMYATLGLGWGNSLLAFIALAMVPIPWIFYRYGERIRKSPRFQYDW